MEERPNSTEVGEGPRRALILEGPAGSGKSTAIRRLMDGRRSEVWVGDTMKFKRPRSYEGAEGAQLALVKDFSSVAFMMTSLAKNVVIDRFGISAIVYEELRRNPRLLEELPPDEDISTALDRWMDMISNAEELGQLWGLPLIRRDVTWVVLLPPMRDLINRRKGSGTAYPFDVVAERDMYSNVCRVIQEHGIISPNGWTFNLKLVIDDEDLANALR